MTEEDFRQDLHAAVASHAEAAGLGMREAFAEEVAERLRDAGELPEIEPCAEWLVGKSNRRLELDGYAFDEADDSLHLAIALRDGPEGDVVTINLTGAREQGFNRLLAVYEQARSGWLVDNLEESRPLWALARQIGTRRPPAALRLHVLTDRAISERLREIPSDMTSDGVPISFQIWDLTRLKRIHDALSVRDDLIVDLSDLPGGGLPVLPAAVGSDEYVAYLAVVPGCALADIYIRHGSRLLEGNVRTFLGRRGNINKGIAATLAKEPSHFFAYNNGIAATASAVTQSRGIDGNLILTSLTDLQIVNGAQTTASLAALRREKKLPDSGVFVPMKLSVVSAATGETLIPRISRYSNSQNAVKASDFFANHEFHRRVEQFSRRVLAPAKAGSQVQTHWYYERARGGYLNDQAGLTPAKKEQFLRLNPRDQVIRKTDLAKSETCFDLLPDVACRGGEKAFIAYAERVTDAWREEKNRSLYSEDWFKAAVVRWLMFRKAEVIVSNAPWYAPSTRAQVVAHALAKLSYMCREATKGGQLDYLKVWAKQKIDGVLEAQLYSVAEAVWEVLRTPPTAGQHVGEWAKQQACRKRVFDLEVEFLDGMDDYLVDAQDASAGKRERRDQQRVDDTVEALSAALKLGGPYWAQLRTTARAGGLLSPEEDAALAIASMIPKRLPSDQQAARIMAVKQRCADEGLVQ